MAAYSKIDRVEPAPKFGNTGSPGWGFHAWSNLLDDEAPHRRLLAKIAAAHPEVIVTLPDPDRYEDYVEGFIKCGSHEVWVYFETILSHLWLWSSERQSADWARALVVNAVAST
jgi:hypothetical protein